MEEQEQKIAQNRIIRINKDLCTLCSECVIECIGGAKIILESEFELKSDYFCEGLGGCAEKCPTGAISFEIKET